MHGSMSIRHAADCYLKHCTYVFIMVKNCNQYFAKYKILADGIKVASYKDRFK